MSTPIFGHGQLRLYLLSLLEEGPMSGYDIIRALEQRFDGLYSPSAGTIYPRLAKLEEDGLVTRTDEGRRSSYAITADGRAELQRRSEEVSGIDGHMDDSAARLAEELRRKVTDGATALWAQFDAAQIRRWETESAPGQDDSPRGHGPGGDTNRVSDSGGSGFTRSAGEAGGAHESGARTSGQRPPSNPLDALAGLNNLARDFATVQRLREQYGSDLARFASWAMSNIAADPARERSAPPAEPRGATDSPGPTASPATADSPEESQPAQKQTTDPLTATSPSPSPSPSPQAHSESEHSEPEPAADAQFAEPDGELIAPGTASAGKQRTTGLDTDQVRRITAVLRGAADALDEIVNEQPHG